MDRPSSHSQRAPYARKEGRKSLFSKMKDSMRDMLSPSWLTDLVHNVKKESPSDDKSKGSDQLTGMQPGQSGMPSDNSPSQTPILPQGQASMMGSSNQQAGINRDLQFKNRGTLVGNGQPRTLDFAGVGPGIHPSGTLASPFQHGAFPPPISEFTSAQLPLARITEKSDSIMAQEDTMSQRSDGSKSTSGCSSMVPQTDIPQRLDSVGDKRKAPDQVTLGGTSPQEQQVAKRQRLHAGAGSNQTFNRRLSDTFISKAPPTAVTNRPAFNTSLFGSPLNTDSSLLGTSVHESSFYPGKTKFGGRSSLSFRSQRKNMDLNQSLPSRLSVPVKAFMKARPRLTPSKEAVTSSTAKRILEALDKMPTPLNDAKKIPMVPRQWTESPSFFSRDTNRSMTRTGPPTQKLNISSQASISKNRQVSFAPLQKPKASSSQVQDEIRSRPTRQDTVVLNSDVSAQSGKMKRDKSYHKGSASVKTTLEEDDTVIIPNLNTEFTLPVSSMPQFNFASSVPKSDRNMNVKSSVDSPVKQALNFTFSSPIIEPVPANKPESPQKFAGFQFSSPISVEKSNGKTEPAMSNKPFVSTSTSFGSAPAFTFSSPATKSNMDITFTTAPKPKPKINGPIEGSFGGIKVASELKQGSVMDILGGNKSFTPSSLSSAPLSTAPPLSEIFKKTGWSCEVCLINNKDADSKCVACQTPKPGGQKPKGDSQLSTGPPLSEIFKKTGWSCEVCLINNKEADSKCVACQTPKPGGHKPKGDSQLSTGPPLSEIFKKTGWSCEVCLINNKDADSKCVACQTPKPGKQKPKDVSSVQTSDPSEPLKSDLFAKFKQPAGSWTCDTCLIQNKPDDIKCVACQTRKPGSASSTSSPLVSSIQPGNWICNICLIQNKKDDSICGACKAAKSTSKPSDLNKSDSLFAKFKPAVGSWECEVCLVQNKADDHKCVACQTQKPLKFFKHPPGDWTCDTCLVNNKESAVNCVACNYARPGPPRTQAVPSIAKSYTVSQASGFNLPSTESGGLTISSTGGFKFTVPTSASSTGSGFDVSKINTSKNAESKLSGGFKFNSNMKSETTTGSGFKFGSETNSESVKSNVNSGGFKINAITPAGDKPASGFQLENKDIKPENKEGPLKSGGFQIGKQDNSLLSNVPNSSSEQISEGFVFGQKSDSMATKSETNTTTSVPGGFTFKSLDSKSTLATTNATETVTNTSKGIGGFNFTTLGSNSMATTSCSTIGNFAFSATKVTDPIALSGTSNPLDTTKPSVGGFSLSQKSSDSNTSISPFTFAQKSTSVASPTKRGRDEGEPAMKKPFGQPASTSSTPFQLGATTTTSNSTSPFVFGQTTSTTSTGLFAFGQKNSTPSSAAQPVFGLQNAAPATSAVPSVFGQQNSTIVNTSSTSASFVFGGQNNTPVITSTTTLPVFGQTNSVVATTTSTVSTPSLFQFGQANKTAASTPFNFAAQSSGQTPVFGNNNFNFNVQKTENNTTSSAPGLFKFGGTPSQPAPATTPAFGSGSAFGSSSTPAFGTGSASTIAFSGNAPSTTPAFGATPPAFGSSNSSTGQATPAFGGNMACVCVSVMSSSLSTTLNVNFLSTNCCLDVVSSCLKYSTTYTASVCTNLTSSPFRNCKYSNNAIAESCPVILADKASKVYQSCNEKIKTSKLSLPSTDTQSRLSKEESFFDGCVDFIAKQVKGDLIESDKLVYNAAIDDKIKASRSSNGMVFSQRSRCQDEGSYSRGEESQSKIKTDKLVDEVCQTDGTVDVKLETKDEETGHEKRGLNFVKQLIKIKDSQSKGIQTELSGNEMSVHSRKTTLSAINNINLHGQNMKTTSSDINENKTSKVTYSESRKSEIKSNIVGIPKTGAANEPLSCGKLFVVPFYIDSLDNSTRLATAITQPLMTSRLPVPPSIGMPLTNRSNDMLIQAYKTSQIDKTEMSSSCNYTKNGHTRPQRRSLVSPLFSISNLPHGDLNPSNTSAAIFSRSSLSSNSLPLFYDLYVPRISVTQPRFDNLSFPNNSATSTILGQNGISNSMPVFGFFNLPNGTGATSLSVNRSVSSNSLFSPTFCNLNLPTSCVNLPVYSRASIKSSSVSLRSQVETTILKEPEGLMKNKAGFILNMPFAQRASFQKPKVSNSIPKILTSSQSSSTYANDIFVFGGNKKTIEKPFSQTSCQKNTFLQNTKMFDIKSCATCVSEPAGCSTNGIFMFGSSSESDKSSSASKKSFLNNMFSNTVVMQSDNVQPKCSSRNDTGVFSFQGPSVLNDVVMEDASCSSGSENVSIESQASRKVKFSFSKPIVSEVELCNKDSLNENKVCKSILKTKINELRSAFNTATIAGKETKEQPNFYSSAGEVDKLPSDSCIYRERDVEAQTLVCNSKSMPFTSDFMMKDEHGEGKMDTSVATKPDQKLRTLFTENTQQSDKIFPSMSQKLGPNFSPSQGSDKTFIDTQSFSQNLNKKTVNFGVGESDSLFSNVFNFTAKENIGSNSKKSPPLRPMMKFENCYKSNEVPTISTCSATFSRVNPNVFVFSAALPPCKKKSMDVRRVEVQKRSKYKPSIVSAFSGKVVDINTYGENEVLPVSSRQSKSSESTQSSSGSDVSTNSSACSSDSGHSVSTSSSSSSSSDDSDDDIKKFNSQPMEDDIDSGGTEFSGLGNRSWNAYPFKEDTDNRLNKDFSRSKNKDKICMLELLVNNDFYSLSQSVNKRALTEYDRWCGLIERVTDYVIICHYLLSGVFGNTSQPAAPAQSNSVFQFGAKPAESTPAAPSAGFNFSASANPAGLGTGGANFNFTAQAPAANAFSATGPSTPSDRKIKKAVRKIRR